MGRLKLRATPVGGALLVHPKGRLDERAAGFAGGLARDPQHTLVVVDLPAQVLADEWEAVAKVLSSSRHGSMRMVFGRGRGDDVRKAAGRIADRLGREVLAPDGALVPTLAGGLFVPGDEGAAWLRFRPGRAVEPDSQRFPKPRWEFTVPTRPRPAGLRTTAQPVPSGVWLRNSGDPLSGRHRRAVETVPADTENLLVVLGSPGTEPLPVDDVAGYWTTVLPNARSAVRFVLYGTLDTPDSLAPGQGLANALDHEVVLYAELPSGVPGRAGHTEPPDHTVYSPAHDTARPAHPESAGEPPRTALGGEEARPGAGAEAGPGTPSGPTVVSGAASRGPTTTPEAAPSTVATMADGVPATVPEGAPSARPTLPGDGATSDGAPEPGASTPSAALVPEGPEPVTTPVLAARTPSRQSVPRIRTESGGSEPSTGTAEPRGSDTAARPDSPAGQATSAAHAVAGTPSAPVGEPVPPSGSSPSERNSPARGTAPEADPGPHEPGAVSPDPPAVDTDPDRAGVLRPDTSGPAADASPVPGTAPAPPRTSDADADTDTETDTDPLSVLPDGVGPGAEAGASPVPATRPVRPAAPRFRLESGAPAPEPVSVAAPVPAPAATAGAPVTAPAPAGEAPGVRVQPVPRTAACALPPERGVAQERDWVRRTYSEQYNATAGSVSRMMSESPGLRGGSRTEAADALTELVAVRLYLSGDSRTADAAVRTATAGPHVPLARCVTAGLRRLPSYRGPALLRTRLADAERAWYRDDRLVTEWAFCHARTSLHAGPRGGGAADVLIWSMTARRTGALDPAVPDRVVFLPGTSFKVLRTVGDAVLMREVSPSEIAVDGRVDLQRVKLDEIALKGLGNILDALEKAGTDAKAESADPPGLILTPATGRTGRTEGAKP
ncbi:hypothetical protein [Streptomyces sp. NPDC048200]|uniref:hypothetical protein n=1 Tax=Streptomyces sp. NPDC048200 TaxID=3365512 RepID=UPI00372257A0